jgi:mono/diheme cytochrome c family protein
MQETNSSTFWNKKAIILFSLILFSIQIPVMAQEETEAAAETNQETEQATDDGIPTDEAVISQGESIFKGNCTQCHAINEVVIGPALRNVHERLELDYLKRWIKNSQAVIQSGDEYAVNLYNEYNQTVMPSYPFTDEELMAVLAYIKAESAKPVETASAEEATGDAGETTASGEGVGIPSSYLTVIFAVLLFILVLILVVLVLTINVLRRYLNQREDLDDSDKEIVDQKIDFGALFRSPAFIGMVVFFLVAVGFKNAIDGLFNVGVQQGYQPEQPIAFSHKIHAGQYQIDCQYCHTGVRKSASANIPSANICMNCHSAIKTESPEIQKIYAAVDNNRPIEWVRVHNLPDLAYFNHAQHVQVGGLECENCHGPIEEMEVVAQWSKLTMGWCINCHRETPLNTEGNGYYDKLVETHNSVRGKEVFTVEMNGGLECAKCHY